MIGVFDSGVGGLSVLKEVLYQLPHEDIIYLADTARLPYGNKSPEEIIKINQEIIPFLISRGAKLVIIACGTSSAIAYPALKDLYPVEMINLIGPGSQAAVKSSHNGQIGLIATQGTVNSGAYQEAITAISPNSTVIAQACPLFVPLIEGGHLDSDETRKIAKGYLKPILDAKADTLILGCTHYPHLAPLLKQLVGPRVTLVDPAIEAVAEAKTWLKRAGTLREAPTHPKYEFLVTGPVPQFEELGSLLLGKPISHAKHVII